MPKSLCGHVARSAPKVSKETWSIYLVGSEFWSRHPRPCPLTVSTRTTILATDPSEWGYEYGEYGAACGQLCTGNVEFPGGWLSKKDTIVERW